MSSFTALRQRPQTPRPPPEIATEVELWARQRGRSARMQWVPTLLFGTTAVRHVWVIHLELRPNDPKMLAFKEGRAEKPPTEQVWLHVPNLDKDGRSLEGKEIPNTMGLREPKMIGVDINALGAAGVREFLERDDTWSGRGEHGSLMESLQATREHNADVRRKVKAEAREENRQALKEERRRWLGIPQIVAGISLGKKKTTKE